MPSTKTPIMSPSILSADFSRLGEEIADVERAGGKWIHVDVMDGHFVPNLTIGPTVIRSIRKCTSLPLDVHLMIEEPLDTVEDYAASGADIITVHVEACTDVRQTLDEVRRMNKRPGLALRPKTPLETIRPYLEYTDLVLVMTVEPGFGGQKFMAEPVEKIRLLREMRFDRHISVDGGISQETAKIVLDAGADVLVAGSYIFGQSDRGKAIRALLGK